jgi:hypothetical protein
MMKGGGCYKRDRRFLTIECLSLKNEHCSDNIIEMTAVVELFRPSMDGQCETIRGLGLSGWVLVVLLNKNKGKAFNSSCIVTLICMTSHNGLFNIYYTILFATYKCCSFRDDMARGLDRIGLTQVGTRGDRTAFLKSRRIKHTAAENKNMFSGEN